MAKAGYCSVCNENVYLTEFNDCPRGHPANCITGIFDTEPMIASTVADTGTVDAKLPLHKKWQSWAIALVLVAALAILVIVLSQGDAEKPAPVATAVAEKTAAVGDPLRIGGMVITVDGTQMTKELKSTYETKPGNWLIVMMTVENESKQAISLGTEMFKLREADGTTYEADSQNTSFVDSEQGLFRGSINPKLETTGAILFALPEGIEGLRLQILAGESETETGTVILAN